MSTNDSSEILKSFLPEKSERPPSPAPLPGPHPAEDAELPHVVIEPKSQFRWINLREIWQYRELLYFLMWRDVKVRYKQTAVGVLWVILQPLLMMMIFSLFFGRLAGIGSDEGIPYALFAYAGLLPWTFFSTAVGLGANSLVNSSGLVTKIYFPRLIVPIAAVGAVLIDLAISLIVLAGLMVYWRIGLQTGLIMLPALIGLITILALGLGTLMSALNVKYRDIRIVLPFALQIWFFLSPIIYPLQMIPAKWRWAMALNPITGIAEGFRSALYRNTFDWQSLGISAAVALLLLACAIFVFRRMERQFADVI
ncbi:MAG TPA: ABC transporter permease [Pyrinomonadaceae bacterium]|nr:ABC transporter permease [Pyrinomonadaceae bacterium]